MNEIYEINEDNSVRYVLGKYETKAMICFGINPSTATKEKADTTITKVFNFAKQIGCNGYIMLNICPIRATHIKADFPIYDEDIHFKNLEYISTFLNEDCTCIAAWGESITTVDYFIQLLEDINAIAKMKSVKWLCLNKTKNGHPRHPSRLSYKDATFELFNMDDYIKSIRRS